MPDKILFLKQGSFSLTNDSVFRILDTEFANFQIDVIDANDVQKKNFKYYHYLKNIFFFIREYGKDFVLGYKPPRSVLAWFLSTSYISRLTTKYVQKEIKSNDYRFTFQTQSIFNGKKGGIPHFVYTDHTTKTNLYYPNINPRLYIRSDKFIEQCESKVYNDADMIFTFGSSITYSLLNQYNIPREKVETVFAGINISDNYLENPSKYFSKKILFVGVEWERKGGPLLLKAFEKVLVKHPDASLTIVGCSPKNITLPNCQVVGRVTADKVADYYNNAAIFCLPTLREPFGIVFVEAMRYKLPVLSSNIGSIPDMVVNNYNGFLIDNSVEEYTDKICMLLDNPALGKEWGENGFKYGQSKFTWEIAGKKMKETITNFIDIVR